MDVDRSTWVHGEANFTWLTVRSGVAVVVVCTSVVMAAAALSWTWFRRSDVRPSTGEYDPATGIGRGAPGFMSNVQKVPVPADIVARIRAGEEVSAEEITAAQARVAANQPSAPKPENEWLPKHLQSKPGGAGNKGRRKKKK